MFVPDREALAWAAGFFDGEGHTGSGSYRNGQGRQTRNLYISVAQTDRRVLDRFHRAVGGVGAVMGPYTRDGNRQQVWHYRATGFPQVMAVLGMIGPFLGEVKITQAADAVTRYRAWPTRQWTRRVPIDTVGRDEITRRHQAGESASAIARATGVDRSAITRHLRALAATIG